MFNRHSACESNEASQVPRQRDVDLAGGGLDALKAGEEPFQSASSPPLLPTLDAGVYTII